MKFKRMNALHYDTPTPANPCRGSESLSPTGEIKGFNVPVDHLEQRMTFIKKTVMLKTESFAAQIKTKINGIKLHYKQIS